MKQNLDTLRDDILKQLGQNGFTVFHSYSRMLETGHVVSWNTRQMPDFRPFLDVARRLGVSLVTFSQEQLAPELIEGAVENLEGAEFMSREERRAAERKLKEYRMYAGFTCSIELAFDFDNRMYLFAMHTEWYDEIMDLLDEIDAATPEDDDFEDEDGSVGGGYYSRN